MFRPRALQKKKGNRKKRGKTAVRQQRRTFALAPGHVTTTVRGSLYNSILRSMARISKLELHAHFFNEFKKRPSAENARKLLEKIGVYHDELKTLVFADRQFKAHQQRRTVLLKNRAARRDMKARSILKDPKISDGRGNWRGDLDEAIEILYGARRPRQWERGRNVRILKRARLMFDRTYRGEQAILYLYPRKFYRLFQKARSLTGA